MQTGTVRLRELTIRYTVKRLGDGTQALTIPTARAPRECAAALMRLLEDEPSEVFAILCLNTKLRVLAYHEVSRGSLDSSSAHPREVFRAAILANAAAIILAHYVARHIMALMCRRSLCDRTAGDPFAIGINLQKEGT